MRSLVQPVSYDDKGYVGSAITIWADMVLHRLIGMRDCHVY